MSFFLPALFGWKARRLLRTLSGAFKSLSTRGLGDTLRVVRERIRSTISSRTGHDLPTCSTPGHSIAAHATILVLDAMMPDPARDSGSVRMLGMLSLMRSLGHEVAFFPNSGNSTNAEIGLLREMNVDVIGTGGMPSLPAWLKRHSSQLRAVIFSRHEVAEANWQLISESAPNAARIFDTVDLHFLRLEREARIQKSRKLMRLARLSRRQELKFTQAADRVFVVSGSEKELLSDIVPTAEIHILSNIHEVQGCKTPYEQRQGLLFVGGFGHSPNRDAVFWLLKEILPEIHRFLPETILHLVGDIPRDVISHLELKNVHLHGRVPSLRALMESSLVALAPLRAGAGVKGKINSAMSHGLPVVATSIAAEGMHLTDRHDVLVADTPHQFAQALIDLHTDDQLWRKLSANGMCNIQNYFSTEAALTVLHKALPPVPPKSSAE